MMAKGSIDRSAHVAAGDDISAAIDMWKDMADARELGFSEACVASGIDPVQFRNGLDRGTLKVGAKLRVGRWAFSLRDCFQLVLIRQLTLRAWVPPSIAADLAAQLASQLDDVIAEAKAVASNSSDVQTHFVMFGSTDGPRLYVHRRRDDGNDGYYLPTGERAEFNSLPQAHVRLSAVGALLDLMKRYNLAHGRAPAPSDEDA